MRYVEDFGGENLNNMQMNGHIGSLGSLKEGATVLPTLNQFHLLDFLIEDRPCA